MSFIYKDNNIGPRTVPCGTPNKTGAHWGFAPLITTLCCLLHRNESIHTKVFPLMPSPWSLHFRSSWGGVSKAFSKSNMNVSNWPPTSKIFAQSFITVINWVSQLQFFLKACFLSDRSLFSSRWAIIFVHTICSSILQLGPNIHWTSNYGIGIVFIGNMLSWLSFHNFVWWSLNAHISFFPSKSEICFQKAIVQYITFKTAALYLRKIKHFL